MAKVICVFEDKLGISDGYQQAWHMLLVGAQLYNETFYRFSIYKSDLGHQALIRNKARISPGFNPAITHQVRKWFDEKLDSRRPDAVLVMDLALFGLFDSDWNAATIDNLRGGVYPYKTAAGFETIVVITCPLSAINRRMEPKEVARLNQGAYNKAEWEAIQTAREAAKAEAESEEVPLIDEEGNLIESEEKDKDSEELHEEFFFPPYKIPYGRFVLRIDINRLARAAYRRLDVAPRFRYRLVRGPSDADTALATLSKALIIASDCETHPTYRGKTDEPVAIMTCIGYAGLMPDGTIVGFLFPITKGKSIHSGLVDFVEYYWDIMAKINDLPIPFTFQNGGYDNTYYLVYHLAPRIWAYDSMVMFWARWPELPKDLAFITSIVSDSYQFWKLGIKSDDIEAYWYYCAKDCFHTLHNTLLLAEMLNQDSKARINFQQAMGRVTVLWAMSQRGIRSDETALAMHSKALNDKKEIAYEKFRFLVADPNFNINSAPQKSYLFYTLMGLPLRNAKGRSVRRIEDASTGQAVMRMAKTESPIVRRIVEALQAVSEPSKQISNVIGIKRRAVSGGRRRLFTSYDGVATTTTRAGSRKAALYDGANLQNIRKDYRDFMQADENSIQLDVDFSAADDVYVTFESGDPKKAELFYSGKDSHAFNATIFFDNWTYEQVVAGKKAKDERVVHPIRGIRQITKKLGHGANYLMAALTLLMTAGREAIVAAAKELGHERSGNWTQDQLVEFCLGLEGKYRQYYTRFKREGGWYDDIRRELIKTGGITTAYSYYQRFLGDAKSDDVLRAATATLGQANTAGRINDTIMELELGYIRREFRDGPNPHWGQEPLLTQRGSHGVSLRLQTHDSLTFNLSLAHAKVHEGAQRIIESMSRPCVIRGNTFAVRLESEIGLRWGNSMVEWNGNIDSFEDAVIRAQKKEAVILKAQADFSSSNVPVQLV